MDIWGAGSVLFELISLYPLFPGSDEVDQLNRIHKVVGTPPSTVLTKMKLKNSFKSSEFHFPPEKGVGIRHFIPHASSRCVSLITRTLIYDYSLRINAKEALRHAYFDSLNLKLTDEPDLIPEAENEPTSKKQDGRDKTEQEAANKKKNPQEPSAERERKPKRSNVPEPIKEKMNTSRHRSKKVKQTEDKHHDSSKMTRRQRPAASSTKLPTKLPSLNTSRHKNTNVSDRLPSLNRSRHKNTNMTDKSSSLNVSRHKNTNATENKPRLPKKRNPRFANVKSSGYGINSRTAESPLSNEQNSNSTEDSRARNGRRPAKKPVRLPPIQR